MLPDKPAVLATGLKKSTSHWFASAANAEPAASSSASILNRIYTPQVLYALQAFAVPLAFWFKPLCVCVALVWLVYRASQVLKKPLNELSFLLGFDLPSAPFIDLASIKADGAIVHWTLPEKPKAKSQLKYEIYVNGEAIDNVSIHESAVKIFDLQPASFYVVRVALLHSNEFSSKSQPIRFRTKAAATGDFFFSPTDSHETDQDGSRQPGPRIVPYRALKDITPASPTSAPMTREGSSGTPRRTSVRRHSPATLAIDGKHDPHPDDSEPPEGAETIQQLTEKLDSLRRQVDQAEQQAKEEEEEETRIKEELINERDKLKAEAMEKEKASKNLKKEVQTLERQNAAAQQERSKQYNLLLQKKKERQQMKDDMIRWDREAEVMRKDVERIHEEKAKYFEQLAVEKEALRNKLAEETAKVRAVDEDVKEKIAEIKKLDRTMKPQDPNGAEPEPNLVEQMQKDAEEERIWQARKHKLSQDYHVAYSKMEASKRFHTEQMRYLESLRAERRRQDEMAQQFVSSPSTQERLPQRGTSQRSRHAQSRHSTSDSPRLGAFPPVTQSPFASTISPVSSGFSSAPFLNIHNGMTIPGPTDNVSMSAEDKERLTGGAPMSPGAGAELLPADLFSGESDNKNHPPDQNVQILPGLGGSLPGLPPLPGPSLAQQLPLDYPGPGPASPGSVSSRSPSIFASPQASQHNLHIGSPEGFIDADRRSIRSTRSNRAPSGGTSSRFSGMFGIKQRSKAMSEDGPPLAKSSSMPRQDQYIQGLDAATRKRNSSISGTVFGPMEAGMDGSVEPTAANPARKAFGLFSREKSGGWPSSFAFGRRPTSPRPGSTHSTELPRPSADASRWGVDGWPSGDAGARGSPLAFGPGWATPSQSRLYGSRHPSRRPSVQYGATGPPEDIMEDDDSDSVDADNAPNLPPIGTKPSKKTDSGKQLNPAAKNFTSFLSGMKFGSSKDKSGKESGETIDKDEASTPVPSASTTPNLTPADDDSPPNSRKSRDARSMTTTESSLAESGRNSAELARTPSYSNSNPDALAPAPSPSLAGSSKETFMQKITRKSSSSKFTLPTFKREKSRLDQSTASAPGGNGPTSMPATTPTEEEEEDVMSASVGSLRDPPRTSLALEPRDSSKEGNRSSRSWSSVLKLGKKKGNEETPSLSGVSAASEAEDGDEGEEET